MDEHDELAVNPGAPPGPNLAAVKQVWELLSAEGALAADDVARIRGIADGAGRGEHFPDGAAAAAWLAGQAKPGDVVLFKASRSASIERVMNQAFPSQD